MGGGGEGWVARRGIQEEVREGEIRRVSRTESVKPREITDHCQRNTMKVKLPILIYLTLAPVWGQSGMKMSRRVSYHLPPSSDASTTIKQKKQKIESRQRAEVAIEPLHKQHLQEVFTSSPTQKPPVPLQPPQPPPSTPTAQTASS